MNEQEHERWAGANAYATKVAQRVQSALDDAGVTALEIGGPSLHDALVMQDPPLTIRQIAAAARQLGQDPCPWMRR